MECVKHRCPNPNCRAVLAIPRQPNWHRVRCAACGSKITMPPTLRRQPSPLAVQAT